MTFVDSQHPFACPQCGQPVSFANIRCHHCNINLALAVARAASDLLKARPLETGFLYEVDKHLPRFGEFLLRQGDITPAQLTVALERQTESSGAHRTLGQILLEMGAVNREQLDRASLTQVQELQAVLGESEGQLAAQAERLRQLETALAEMAEVNLAAVKVLESAPKRLQLAIAALRAAVPEAAVLAELEALADELAQFGANEK